ncbi:MULTISPECIES: hypothetical protein [Rhizobium/Agrobacterium group]|uniref:hypothetical protein n=1 Tax=Rhizobium/Agrobacterium group TaxID=227290 RepID=UPI001574D129|nr:MULTISPECIES: hypothetical protein [Rhizobium/Agrobacterium group]MCF1446651.1 hypothetical protein [Allorhizobium ampelinum]NSZ53499.1 hypothetical protein [Agrobacterium vitis]NTA32258.1 hypothetical protein [Agrobacterium vitis]
MNSYLGDVAMRAQMMRKNAVPVCVVVVILSATIIPAIFGRYPNADKKDLGDIWSNFIYNYQTLITGFAAVAGAVYTIRQMRISDEKQEERHKGLMDLQIRPIKMDLARAIVPVLQKIGETRNKSEVLYNKITPPLSGEAEQYDRVRENLGDYSNDLVSLTSLLSGDVWGHASRHFDATTYMAAERVRAKIGVLMSFTMNLIPHARYTEQLMPGVHQKAYKFHCDVEALISSLPKLEQELVALAGAYGIDINSGI